MSNYTNCDIQTKLAAIIPIKTLRFSKTRLAVSLGLKERISLSLNLLKNVLESAVQSSLDRVIVLGSDDEVKKLTLGSGAEWMVDNGRGLNCELNLAINKLSRSNIASIYIASDLPLLTTSDIEILITKSEHGKMITLCPAMQDDGTNGLLIPPDTPFEPLLGYHSFPRHVDAVKFNNLAYATCNTIGWGMDIDSPADLESVTCMQSDLGENAFKKEFIKRDAN